VRDPTNGRRVLGETIAFQAFKALIEASGCKWEQAPGNVFLIRLPEDSQFDPEAVFAECVKQYGGELSSA
jgi:hypothetical protein